MDLAKHVYAIIIGLLILLTSVLTYAQSDKRGNRLQITLRNLHASLSKTSKEYEPNSRYLQLNHVYIAKNKDIVKISIDSLTNYNYLDYEIRILYDYTDIPPIQFYQGAIVLYPLSKKRKNRFINHILELKKAGGL